MNALWPYFLAPDSQGADDTCAVSAQGHRVRFANGRELLCGTSGLWNVNLGYGNRAIADSVSETLRSASYLSVFRYENSYAREAANALVRACDPDHYGRVLFSTSGGAANDTAVKLARHYQALRERSGRMLVVSLRDSYHGLTFGGFALTGEDMGQRTYGVDQRLIRHVTANNTDELRAFMERFGQRVAAVVVEPVIGNGARPLTEGYVESLIDLRDQYGFLLIADEVATGFGRTGTMFASLRWSRRPDVLLLSKAMTNGTCAASAVVVSHEVADTFDAAGPQGMFIHAETQGGTSVTCAAIMATLAETERMGSVANAVKLSELLDRGLADPAQTHPWVTGSQGIGCFRALNVRGPDGAPLSAPLVQELVAAVRDAGSIVHPGPSGVQLIPALTYSEAELTELLDCVRRGLDLFADRVS